MNLSNVMRGADPELFLLDGNGNFYSSIGVIGGSKTHPRDIGGGYSVQEDNVAVEFNIPPAITKEEFVNSISHAVDFITKEMAEKELAISIVPIAHFSREQLKHPKAREMGCEPDFNAWTMEVNPRPEAPKTLRSAGGHLHISWDNPDMETASRVIKAHDLFCGVPSLLFDNDKERRAIYGKAGACRFKDYGVEYRTLSNFWIKSKELTEWLFNQSEKAIQFLNDGKRIDVDDFDKIISCINESNDDLVFALNEKYSII